LTEIEQATAISSEWDLLLARSRCNRAYSCSKWYLATHELVPQLQPLVFIARRGNVLSGILPLWLESNRRLARFGDNFGDHLDIIAADEDMEVITGLLAFALQGTGSYDRMALGQVKRDSNYVRAAKALGLDEVVDHVFAPENRLSYAVLDITRGYDDYMSRLGRKFRLNLHRMCNKAEREGFVVCELTPMQLNPELLPGIFLSLHLSRFGEKTDFKSAEVWMHKLFPSLFAEGRMRVFAVLHQDQIVAIDLEMVTRSGMYSFNGGFLPEISKYEPGKLLIHKAIQQACLEGLSEFDLGWLGQEYKLHWRPTIREVGALQFVLRSEIYAASKIPRGKDEPGR
jgi:GNAT acetyltransferase-like protein